MLPTHLRGNDARLDSVDRELWVLKVQVLEEAGGSSFGGRVGGDVGGRRQPWDMYVSRGGSR